MIERFITFFAHLISRWLPSAFSFSIILTFIVFLAGSLIENQPFLVMIDYWGSGVWKLLPFAMQMVLILLFGSVVADAPIIKALIVRSVTFVKSPVQGVLFVTLISTISSWINWGMGLIIGALIAVEVGKRVKGSHFPLLVASAYSGFIVWHGGLSGSIPLKLASPSGFLSEITSGVAMPISHTILTPFNLGLTLIFIVTLPLLNMLMLPKDHLRIPCSIPDDHPIIDSEFSLIKYLPNFSLFIFIALFIIRSFYKGSGVSLNMINMILFALAIFFHTSLESFLKSVESSVKSTSGIIIQFPLYAGIMGMMSSSGLTQSLSYFFISISTQRTFPLMTYLSAGIVNFFVPSGGGQWAVQGPIVIPAAKELGVPVTKAAMALAWGDAWTNMLQPFWALPILGISKLSIKDIMPYCFIVAIWVGAVTCCLLFFQ